MADWIWDHFCGVAEAKAGLPAILHGQASISFKGLRVSAERLATTLSLAKGDRVVVCAPNSIGFAVTVAAVWSRGGIPVIINADASDDHKQYSVTKTQARLIFTEHVLSEDSKNRAIPTLDQLQEMPHRPLAPHGAGADDPASLLFTSGSTGSPKGVVQLSATLIDGATRLSQHLGYVPDDKILCPVPFAFDYGWGQLLSLIVCGVPLVLTDPRNAFGLCAAITDHAPSVLASVPAIMADLLLGLTAITETNVDGIRLITNTGSKIPDRVFDLMTAQFPNASISLNYGMTETFRSASLPTNLALQKRHSVGYAVPDVTLVALDENGAEVPQGEVGEIHHIGAGVFHSYWMEPKKTNDVRIMLQNSTGAMLPTVKTGDFGYFDVTGCLYITGRRDRLIKCMGVRLSLDEVETALSRMPELKEVAVVSNDHEMLGARIAAFIVPANSILTEKELKKVTNKFARAHLSLQMRPRLLLALGELPRNHNQKIDYVGLKKTAGEV